MGLKEIVRAAASVGIAVQLLAGSAQPAWAARADQPALDAMCTKDPVVVVLKETPTSRGMDFRPYTAFNLNSDDPETGIPTCLTGLVAGTHMLAGAAANVKGSRSYFFLSDPITHNSAFRASANVPMEQALSFRDTKAGIDYIATANKVNSVDGQRRVFNYYAISLFAVHTVDNEVKLELVGYHPLDTPRFRNLGPLRPTGLGYELTPRGPVVLIHTEKWFKDLNGEPYAGRETIRIRVEDLEGLNNMPVVESLENTWEQVAAGTDTHILSPLGFSEALSAGKSPWTIEKLGSLPGNGAPHASDAGKVPVLQQLNPHKYTAKGYERSLFVK